MAEIGRIMKVGFVTDVPCLYFHKRFRGSRHPFYESVYKKCAKFNKDFTDNTVFLDPNASSLLVTLATKYVELGLLKEGDEVIVSTENHSANYDPWIRAAQASSVVIKRRILFLPSLSRGGFLSCHGLEQ